ncbi:protein FAR1-RELATED SEQUENCE 5-like [Spinacia oleracea]|uniref:Protein FAR1-RELATED SEQUENCE 5-like n=1 Tax=Spinacia oleracea TaxID=3562 RepID=A0ABM3QZM7_SPIOL|nr:protein FAR1-RELATED SEQUENCE 5-like [Spinacia oleracea]
MASEFHHSSSSSLTESRMKFMSVEEGISFYKAYSKAAGFVMRKSTATKRKALDVIAFQYCLCNKAGFKEKAIVKVGGMPNVKKGEGNEDKVPIPRRRLVTRVGCKARMVMKYKNEGFYVVTEFREPHVHPLYTPGCLKFQKAGRKMNILHKKMIIDNSKVNIGPVKTFRLMKELVGSYDNVGASKQDFKKFHRDLKAYIEGSDAQMFVNNFQNKKLLWSAFFFDYEVDEDEQLCKAFWAYPICRKNYELFGDMVSFDTTFQTNRYNMIFGPFTGVDHHKKCVTFGVALIAHEDIVSFEWVFRTFLKAMGGNEPACLITDEDPAMKIAIPKVFQTAEHRFCMWHIMKKMPEKVGRQITQDTLFLNKICKCVWSEEIEPTEFEEKWGKVLAEFKLQDHEWLKQLYEKRQMWIPAYFRDSFLCGIMRTTSRSESENNFYTKFTNPHLTLVEFYMRFESALDAQRHTQGQFDNDSKHKHPECKTSFALEKHASKIYTVSVFYDFQEELEIGCFHCGLEEYKKENGFEIFTIREGCRIRKFDVSFNPANLDSKCMCKMFERLGIPCRHMVWVWKAKMIEYIPDAYVLNRWTSLATKTPIFDLEGNILEACVDFVDCKRMLNELWSEIHTCVSLAQGNEEDLTDLVKNLKGLRLNLEAKKSSNNHENNGSPSKATDIELLIGATLPTEIVVKPPKISKNKGTGVHVPGTGSDKRLKGDKEKAIEQSQKKKRLCRGCGELGYHDIRNCPHKVKENCKL